MWGTLCVHFNFLDDFVYTVDAEKSDLLIHGDYRLFGAQ